MPSDRNLAVVAAFDWLHREFDLSRVRTRTYPRVCLAHWRQDGRAVRRLNPRMLLMSVRQKDSVQALRALGEQGSKESESKPR
jgi:hypothetical protein